MAKDINNIFIPNVTSIPSSKESVDSNKLKSGQTSDFKNLLDKQLENNLGSNQGISLSTHAVKRIDERKIDIDNSEYLKLKDAIKKLKDKGGQESLVITSKAAYIVDVANNKIVTAIDKASIAENVFTKIDSTIVI
jgi:flagellar operon protein